MLAAGEVQRQFIVDAVLLAASEKVGDGGCDDAPGEGAQQDFQPVAAAARGGRFGGLATGAGTPPLAACAAWATCSFCCRASASVVSASALSSASIWVLSDWMVVSIFFMRSSSSSRLPLSGTGFSPGWMSAGGAPRTTRSAFAALGTATGLATFGAGGGGGGGGGRRLAARPRLLLRQGVALGGDALLDVGDGDRRPFGEARAVGQLRIGALERGEHASLLDEVVGDQRFGDAFERVAFAGAPLLDRRAAAAGSGCGRVGAIACGRRGDAGEDQRFRRHQHVVTLKVDAAGNAQADQENRFETGLLPVISRR